MPTPAHRRRILFLAVPLLALFGSGCVVHHYHPEPVSYDYVEEEAEAVRYHYLDGHVIPAAYGGGWCFLEGPHVHVYAPDYHSYYRQSGGFFVYQGPVSFFFFGFHPVPHLHGGGWCRLPGRHVHGYHPAYDLGWRYHADHRYYYWDAHARRPARGWHPAEPAYRTVYRDDARPVTGRPARPATRPVAPGARPAEPAARPARPASRAAPAAARPAAPAVDRPTARPTRPADRSAAPDCSQPGRCRDPQPARGRDGTPAHPGRLPPSRTVLDLGPVEGSAGSPPTRSLEPGERGRRELPPGAARPPEASPPGSQARPRPDRDAGARSARPTPPAREPAARAPTPRQAPPESPRAEPAERSRPSRPEAAPAKTRTRPETRTPTRSSTRSREAPRSESRARPAPSRSGKSPGSTTRAPSRATTKAESKRRRAR